MPSAVTERFGTLEYDPSTTILFPQGLPGFERHRRFLPVEHTSIAPLILLQSLESAELCFLTLPVERVDPAYQPSLSTEDLEALGLEGREWLAPGRDLQFLTILTVAEDGRLTANLLAPVVVNLRDRVAVQAVRCDTRYSHCYPWHEAAVCS
jgi:flagellar assembly factor FliW